MRKYEFAEYRHMTRRLMSSVGATPYGENITVSEVMEDLSAKGWRIVHVKDDEFAQMPTAYPIVWLQREIVEGGEIEALQAKIDAALAIEEREVDDELPNRYVWELGFNSARDEFRKALKGGDDVS